MPVGLTEGTTIGISATLPATIDAPGYAAVVFTDLGEVVDGTGGAVAYTIVPHKTVSRRYPEKNKGSFDVADLTFNLGKLTADAGQVIAKTALASDASFSFEITYPSGDIENFTAKVMQFGGTPIASDTVQALPLTVAVNPESYFEQ